MFIFFFFSSRRRHTRLQGDWSSDVCSSDLSARLKRAGNRVLSSALPGRVKTELRRAESVGRIIQPKPIGDISWGHETIYSHLSCARILCALLRSARLLRLRRTIRSKGLEKGLYRHWP